MELKGEILENDNHCSCGGVIDRLYLIGDFWQCRCFKCGKPFIVK